MAYSQHFSDGEETSSEELCRIDAIKKKSILIKDGNPARYHLKTTSDNLNQSESYRTIIFGEKDPEKSHKTILLVGETGTGKTALINTMINYICGVQREDKIWFEITDDKSDRPSVYSQTSIITVYCVYIQETSVDLTIIDTPGYGDTDGIEHDKKIADSLLPLIKSNDVVQEIHAVCFVMKADQNRLSVSQQYIFDAIQSLFARDIVDKIVLLFTHSDGFPPKSALTAVKEAKVKCAADEKNQPIYFLFNNRQSDTFDEEYKTKQHQSWDLSYRGMEMFFNFFKMRQLKTLQQTKHVLEKREELETNIPKLQVCVQTIQQKLNKMKQSQDALEKHKKDVEENKNFEYTVQVSYKVKVDINPAVASMAMCCRVCEENCHYPGCWWVANPSWCSMMKKNHCTVCPNKCHYSKHVKENKIYVTKTKTETRIKEDLKKKYDDKMNASQSVINTLEKELQDLEKEKIKLVTEAFYCVDGLENMALNTDSLFKLQHIEFIIQMLKEINEPEKAEKLENIKERAGEEKKKAVEFVKRNLN